VPCITSGCRPCKRSQLNVGTSVSCAFCAWRVATFCIGTQADQMIKCQCTCRARLPSTVVFTSRAAKQRNVNDVFCSGLGSMSKNASHSLVIQDGGQTLCLVYTCAITLLWSTTHNDELYYTQWWALLHTMMSSTTHNDELYYTQWWALLHTMMSSTTHNDELYYTQWWALLHTMMSSTTHNDEPSWFMLQGCSTSEAPNASLTCAMHTQKRTTWR